MLQKGGTTMSNKEIYISEDEIRQVLTEIENDCNADSWDEACRL